MWKFRCIRYNLKTKYADMKGIKLQIEKQKNRTLCGSVELTKTSGSLELKLYLGMEPQDKPKI